MYLKIIKIHFHVVPFSTFWSVKYLHFGENLPIRTAHYTFLESKDLEVTKNLHYVLSSEGSQEKVSAHGLYGSRSGSEFLISALCLHRYLKMTLSRFISLLKHVNSNKKLGTKYVQIWVFMQFVKIRNWKMQLPHL